jgi:hypothetical protein
MKFVIILLVLAVAAYADNRIVIEPPVRDTTSQTNLDLCPLCVSFSSQALNQLLNIILNVGVLGSCAKLCSYLPQKTEQTVCNLVCDIVGIELFIKLIKKADLNPIYFCELVKLCPVHDCTGPCITIDQVVVTPEQGHRGGTFQFDMIFTAHNQTGTGELGITIFPPNAMPFGEALLDEGFKPGSYGMKFTLQAEPSEEEPFTPGTYKADLFICEGQCGSKHPHSYVYDVKKTQFQIV